MPRTQFDRYAKPEYDRTLELIIGRRSRETSNDVLAKEVGIAPNTLSRHLHGSSDELKLGEIKAICKALGISKQELFNTINF